METQIIIKRVKDYLHEDGTFIVYRQYFIPSYALAQAAWSIRAFRK